MGPQRIKASLGPWVTAQVAYLGSCPESLSNGLAGPHHRHTSYTLNTVPSTAYPTRSGVHLEQARQNWQKASHHEPSSFILSHTHTSSPCGGNRVVMVVVVIVVVMVVVMVILLL